MPHFRRTSFGLRFTHEILLAGEARAVFLFVV